MDTHFSNLEEFLNQEGMIVLMDKPLGWTSFDVTNKVRVHLKYSYGINKSKAGHAGTLDPLATGLLILCLGKATRKISTLQNLPKTYTGVFRLGSATPSYDRETKISETSPTDHITEPMIMEAAKAFEGDIMQEPPLYSAIKLGGKRAYKFARNKQNITIAPRPVKIHKFEITEIDGIDVHFIIECSKGTYIRSIARDFGVKLKSCAYLNELRRVKIGDHDVNDAYNINEIDKIFRKTF